MKKTLLALSIVTMGMVACKKDDPAPAPKQLVVTTGITLENYDKKPIQAESMTWYSTTDSKAYSMKNIFDQPSLSEKIDFGFNMNDIEIGIFSAATYPQPYGQDAWPKKNAITFKRPTMNMDELNNKLKTNNPNEINVAFIDKIYNEAADPNSKSVNFGDDTVIAFQTASGNRGLISITSLDQVAKTVIFSVFIAK